MSVFEKLSEEQKLFILKKMLKPGGSGMKLADLATKFQVKKTDMFSLVEKMGVEISKLSGHKENWPNVRIRERHIATRLELLQDEATMLIIAATEIEWKHLKNLLPQDMSEEVVLDDTDIKSVRVGFSKQQVIVLAQTMFTGSFKSYGLTKKLVFFLCKHCIIEIKFECQECRHQ